MDRLGPVAGGPKGKNMLARDGRVCTIRDLKRPYRTPPIPNIVNTQSQNNRHILFLLQVCIFSLVIGVGSLAFAAKPTPKPSPSPTPAPSPAVSPTPIAPTPTPATSPTPVTSPTPTSTPSSPTPTIAPSASPTATVVAASSPCPLPVDYGITANSPEKPPKNNQSVCHNGMILCLPPSAYNAHIQHGDAAVAYNCAGKTGNTQVACTGPTPGGR